MKILFLEAVQNFGGARKSTLELAMRLSNTGNEVLVVDFWGSCTPFVNKAKQYKVPVDLIDKRDTPFILYNQNKIRMFFNYIQYYFMWLKYRSIIKKKINDFKADLVIVNNAKTLSILSNSNNYKIAYFARGWFLPNTIPLINKLLIRKKVDIFLAVSQSTRQAIFSGGFASLDKIYVIPNAVKDQAVDEANSSLKKEHNKPFTILHCGGFLETKGQHVVVEIAKKLKEQELDFKVILVGILYEGGVSQKYYASIKNFINENKLNNDIEIILNETEVLDYFKQADVLVHPTHTEGLPRVVMEAMMLGKPVIGNPAGGMTDFIVNDFTGYITNFNDVDDYLFYIYKIMNDKHLYNYLSNNSRNLIKYNYTEENQCNAFNKIKF
ncbi:glycosyltransferase family 4 protein [Flavobacterium sp. CS20]|uniref:glycosyltransferase family 4 protein n=1 Tax=Flavobacterium sp. CS20 TaxID=2775246 RepID=UPI001B3A6B56|nr:glycosyltransferase family 4 protein [Flavobacterium sp. CS20]QTY26671.1 glycosyltransferase family 4 protein [Flavobacterium sp. CS20]